MAAVTVDPFPVHALEGCETALVVFAAAFGGAQDAAHIRDAGMWALCVDSDSHAMDEMRMDYPYDWSFFRGDAFAWLDYNLKRGDVYDVVTLDPFTGDLMDRTIEALPDWCRLARKTVIVGVDGRELNPPAGWRISSKVWRSDLKGGVFWAVLERENRPEAVSLFAV